MLRRRFHTMSIANGLRFLVFLMAYGLTLFYGISQVPSVSASAPPEEQHQGGSIQGDVVLSGPNSRIGDIDVHVMNGNFGLSRTSPTGQFAFDHVPPGRYGLVLSPQSGYVSDETIVLVKDGENVRGIRILARRPGSISGRVTDRNGAPLIGVTVSAIRALSGGGRTLPDRGMMGVCTTDDQGEYLLEGLKSGEYVLLAEPPKKAVVAPNETSTGSAFESIFSMSFLPAFYPGSPDRDGAIPLAVADGGSLTGIDIVITEQRSYCIRSSVGRSDTAAQGRIQVKVSKSFYMGGNVLAEGMAATEHVFDVCGLGPGSYTLVASDGTGSNNAIREFHIANQSQALAPLILQGNISLCGDVRLLNTGTTVEPMVGKVLLRLTDAMGRPRIASEATATESRADGSFCFPSVLRDARYWLSTRAPQDRYIKSADYGTIDATHIPITPTATERLRILLGANGATMAIQVKSSNRVAVAGARVIVAVDPLPRDYRDGDLKIVICDQNGRAEVSGIRPGRYRALAVSSRDVDPGNAYALYSRSVAKGASFDAEDNSTHQIDLSID